MGMDSSYPYAHEQVHRGKAKLKAADLPFGSQISQ